MFTPDGLIQQLGFALLIAAVLAPNLRIVRLFVGLAALVGMTRAIFWTGDAVAAGWMALLLGICLLLLGRDLWENAKVRFTPEEETMLTGLLQGVPRSRARHMIDQGFWLTGKNGDILTREGEPVSHLYYLGAGEARVVSHGHEVGRCRAGDLIGELTVLSGETASATVILDGPARFWCAPASVLRPYVETHDDIRRAIERGFSNALKAKLRASNRTIAESGGTAPAA